MMRDLGLCVLLLALGVAVAEAERWRKHRPSARGVHRFLVCVAVSTLLIVAMTVGWARLLQTATIGVWSTVVPPTHTPVLPERMDV